MVWSHNPPWNLPMGKETIMKPIPLSVRIERVKNRIERLKKLNAPDIVIQNEERILKGMENDLRVLEERKKGA